MCYFRILILLLTATFSASLYAATPETLIAYSQSRVGITSEPHQTQDTLRLYTYYQAKLLNDLTDITTPGSNCSLWGLLEKGHNPENPELSNLEWHASALKAQNWGDSTDFAWINATSQSDMVFGFLNSAYTAVCLAGISTVSDIDLTLGQIQKQSICFLKSAAMPSGGEGIDPHTIKLAIQLGRNIYYKNIYREEATDKESAETPNADQGAGPTQPPQSTITDVLSAHIADLEYTEDSDTDFVEIMENSYTTLSNQTRTIPIESSPIVNTTQTDVSNTPTLEPSSLPLKTQAEPVLTSIRALEKIFLRQSPQIDQAGNPLSETDKHNIYVTALAAMAALDADGQEPDWISEIKAHFSENLTFSNPENLETVKHLLLAAKNDAAAYLYKTPSYFSYGYKKLPEPLNPSMETQNGELLLDSIPLPAVIGRAIPVDIGFMYTKLMEMGDYALQYLKSIDDSILPRIINQIYNDIGISTHYHKIAIFTLTQQIQEGVTLTQQIECPDAITYMINSDRETTAPYPILFALTPEYCQWKDVVLFLDEVTRVVAAPNLIHERTNFKHSFDLTNKDFNAANEAFMRESGIQLTQEEADAIMRGIWYKEILNFTASYHYARSHNLLRNFYEEVLPSAKAANPCLPGKIRQVTNWHEIQLTKQQDYLLSATRMLFPPSHTYEGIQYNTFLDFVASKLSHDFIKQKIEHHAMKHSIFLGGESFGIDDFQKDDNGNYTLKKTRYQTALEHSDFGAEITRESFEDYARELIFNTFVSYFTELNSMNASGDYRYPTAHQLLADDTGIQAFHSGDIVFNETNLPDLPATILNGFGKINGVPYEHGLLKMYEHQLPHVIEAIKRNPYGPL